LDILSVNDEPEGLWLSVTFGIGGELVSQAQTAEMLSLVASSIFDFATTTTFGDSCIAEL
jgi:hypothetical protein